MKTKSNKGLTIIAPIVITARTQARIKKVLQKKSEKTFQIPCLKCDQIFESKDKMRDRLCRNCRGSNKLVRHDLEGWG